MILRKAQRAPARPPAPSTQGLELHYV